MDVEKAIAQEIAEKLRLRLTGEQKRRLSRPLTQNAEAYQNYLESTFGERPEYFQGLRRADVFQDFDGPNLAESFWRKIVQNLLRPATGFR